jgi:TonB family protein
MHRPESSRSSTNSRAEDSAFEFFPGSSLDEKPLWAALYENLRDAVIPSRLPPLDLTSKPIPVPDRMAARTNHWAIGTATAINGGMMVLVILLSIRPGRNHFTPQSTAAHVDLNDIFAPLPAKPSDGGNGAGSNDPIEPIEGRNPEFSATPIAPPMVPVVVQPKLPEESTIAIRLPDNSSMPKIGVPNSANVTLDSNGPGGPNGVGTGNNGTYGPGEGNRGWGPGSGNSIYLPGQAGVIVPALIFAPEAEFSDEARSHKYQGVCVVALIVDSHGNPQNVHVIRSLGMGLDEKAIQAVRGYRFKPGTKDGKPVPVQVTVEVDFHLY